MAEEVKEYLDYDGLVEYDKKSKELFQDLTIQDVEEAFNELDESDPSYSAFYDVIQKAKEATANADSKAAAAVTATNNANTATSNADAATERANKAAERIETVNDMTTGINLIRGSRDFRITTTEQVSIGGFRKNGNPSFYTDENGFVVLNCLVSGYSGYNGMGVSQYVPVKPSTKYTLSFEFMVDDVNAWDKKYVGSLNNHKSDYSRINVVDLSYKDVGVDNVESGKWYKAVYRTTTSADAAYNAITLYMYQNGSIHFRKPVFQEGHINRPDYSVAPSDLALEPINDITTIPNLLIGTRDFSLGTTKVGTFDTLFKDGFCNTATAYSKTFVRSDGFTVLNITRTGLSAPAYTSWKSSAIPISDNDIGKMFTIYFEYMVDDGSAIDDKRALFVELVDATTRARVAYANIGFTDVGIPSDTVSGKWYECKYYYTIPESIRGNSNIYLSVYSQLWKNGSCNYAKLYICRGYVERPEWNASPFDTAPASVETDGFIYRGLPDTDDFDKIIIQGNYIINKGANYYKNDPHATHGYGQLLVFKAATYVIQIRISNSADVNLRPKWRTSAQSGNGWGNWTPFGTS